MPLLFKTYQSPIASKDGKKRWHPRLIKIGRPVTTYDIGEEIAKRSSMTVGDVLNVIENAIDIMNGHLMNSRSVKLNRLGNFTAIIKSTGKGVDTEEEVSAQQITDLKIRFTPAYRFNHLAGMTKTMCANARFEKYDKSRAKKDI